MQIASRIQVLQFIQFGPYFPIGHLIEFLHETLKHAYSHILNLIIIIKQTFQREICGPETTVPTRPYFRMLHHVHPLSLFIV